MPQLIRNLILAFTFLSASAAVGASEFRHEVTGGALAQIRSETDEGVYGDPSTTTITTSIYSSYGYFFDSHWQGLAYFSYKKVEGDNSTSTILPMVGIGYNFSEDTLNSFFASAMVGNQFYRAPSSHNYSSLATSLEVGRRIQLAPQISWTPSVFIFTRKGGTSTDHPAWQMGGYTGYTIEPFRFSFLF